MHRDIDRARSRVLVGCSTRSRCSWSSRVYTCVHGIGDRYRGRERGEERNPESKISGLPYEQMRGWTDGWTTVIPRRFRSPALQNETTRDSRERFGVLDMSWRRALGQARVMLQGRRKERGRKRERERGGAGSDIYCTREKIPLEHERRYTKKYVSEHGYFKTQGCTR